MTIFFSPLSTIRCRLGNLVLTSPVSFNTVIIYSEILPLLGYLKIPREISLCYKFSKSLGFNKKETENIINLLLKKEILLRVEEDEFNYSISYDSDSTCMTFSKKWWDLNDMGYYDIRNHQITQILNGSSNSLKANFPLDSENNPTPWFSYPAIDYLNTLDFSKASIFEYGSGASTLYFETKCESIYSVEHDSIWLDKMKSQSTGKTKFIFEETKEKYTNSILKIDKSFDLIIIDATPNFRENCVENAMKKIAENGIIILDDSAVYKEAYKKLLEIDPLPMDFIGLSAIEDIVQTTSFFINKNQKQNNSNIKKNIPNPKGTPGYNWNT